MTLTSKFVFVFGLLCAFLLILFSGQANVRHFEKIQSSIEEIYEDRLVVKGIIFELSSLLHQKEIANISGDKSFYTGTNASVNAQIADHLRDFRATKLTPDEEKTLNRFSADFKELYASEEAFDLSDGDELTQTEANTLSNQLKSLHEDLKILADIQLSQGRLKMIVSTKTSDKIVFFVPRPKH